MSDRESTLIAVPLHEMTDEARRLERTLDVLMHDDYYFKMGPLTGGSHARNVNWLMDKGRELGVRDVIILDHDVELLDPDFIEKMTAVLDVENAGVVGCIALNGPPLDWRRAHRKPRPYTLQPWLPGYCHAYRLDRLPEEFTWDEACPGGKGRTDIDACYQLRDAGLNVLCCTETALYHPKKVSRPPSNLCREQDDYMKSKWGPKWGQFWAAPAVDLPDLYLKVQGQGASIEERRNG